MRIDLFKSGGAAGRMLTESEVSNELAELKKGLRHYLPDFVMCPTFSAGFFSVSLPAALGADYAFSFHIQATGERHIDAKLLSSADANAYFWYIAQELADYHNDPEELRRCFWRFLHYLLTCESRIIQQRGLAFWKFRCEAQAKGDWIKIASIWGLRGQFVPAIRENNRVFASVALAPNQVDSPVEFAN